MAKVATKRAIAILGGAAVLSAAVFLMIVSRQGDNGANLPNEANDSSEVDEGELLRAFEPGEPLGEVRAAAMDLVAADLAGSGAVTAACTANVSRLDAAGTPTELFESAQMVEDPALAEAALEQQAAVSSVLAACRGEAPVSVDDALAELRNTNRAVEELLARLAADEAGQGEYGN